MQYFKKIFQTEILIQVADINYGGHLGNDRFLTFASEARVRWLRSLGWSEKDIDSSGCGLIVTEAAIKFENEAFLGQTLVVDLSAGRLKPCSLEFHVRMIEKESNKTVGNIKTKVAFFDYLKRKVVKVPQGLIIKLSQMENNE